MSNLLKYFLPLLCFLVSCKKDKTQEAQTGSVNIAFAHFVGQDSLKINQQSYVNAHGDSFSVSKYIYYVTDLTFIKSEGSSYTHDDFKFLIDASDSNSWSNLLKGIPAGTYSKIALTLGVDSIHNVSGAQTGALDPIHGMFWDWNTGYIMAKMEGISPQSTAPLNKLSFHLGGFSGAFNVVKRISFDLSTPLEISKDKTPMVKFKSDVNKWFEGDYIVDFAYDNSVMSIGRLSHIISENYKHHLSLMTIEN
jgi:hypothetical protein